MRKGYFNGGSCSGLLGKADDHIGILLVVNRREFTYEIYGWSAQDRKYEWGTAGGSWDIRVHSMPVGDGKELYGMEQIDDVMSIQHPNIHWNPTPPPAPKNG